MTAVWKATWQVLGKPELQKTFSGPAGQQKKITGCFLGHLSHKEKETTQQVFVVNDLYYNLLGLPSITALSLVEATSSDTPLTEEDIKQKLPTVFSGLGNLGEEYYIK